jgi:hypothetical protein
VLLELVEVGDRSPEGGSRCRLDRGSSVDDDGEREGEGDLLLALDIFPFT